MKDLDGLIFDSQNGSEKKKEDPEKMDQHHTICKNLVEHLLAYSKSLSSSWSLILFDESLMGWKEQLSLWPSGAARSQQ
jgi:hypothetical protein